VCGIIERGILPQMGHCASRSGDRRRVFGHGPGSLSGRARASRTRSRSGSRSSTCAWARGLVAAWPF